MEHTIVPVTSLDLDLLWVLSQPAPSDPTPEPASTSVPRLGTRNLFLLACRECYRTGDLGRRENQLLKVLCRIFQIPVADARKLAAVARRDVSRGRLVSRPLELERLFRKALDLAITDGGVDAREASLLHVLGKVLGFDGAWVSEQLSRRLEHLYAARDPSASDPPPSDDAAGMSLDAEGLVSEADIGASSLDNSPALREAAARQEADESASGEPVPPTAGAPLAPLAPLAAFVEAPPSAVEAPPAVAGNPRTGCWYSTKGRDSKWKREQERIREKPRAQPRANARKSSSETPEWVQPAALGGLGLLMLLLAL